MAREFTVSLDNVTVTASDEEEAIKLAIEDAREFDMFRIDAPDGLDLDDLKEISDMIDSFYPPDEFPEEKAKADALQAKIERIIEWEEKRARS